MKVLFVTSEAYPLAKTGGLADVSYALPLALARCGLDVRLLLPAYPSAVAGIENPRIVAKLDPILGIDDAMLIGGTLPDTSIPVLLVHAPSLFARDGGPYCDRAGHEWPDNARRFAFLSHIAAKVAMGTVGLAWTPDIVHSNDWHTGLVPLLLAQEGAARPGTVFTTHNMAFQGNFPAGALPLIGISERGAAADDIEFYGQISLLKAGLRFADRVTTVSPTYAREVLTAEGGCGLDGVLRARAGDFTGILNGIDNVGWDPCTDRHLPQTYRAGNIAGKRVCKAALQEAFGLPVDPDVPLVGFVSRLTHQKMADVIANVLPWVVEQGAQFVLVGEGEPDIEENFRRIQAAYPQSVSIHIGYSESLAHRLQAGCDILLAPARFEPCGLTQLYALRYGTLPVVRRTGGLADTVVDATGATIMDRTATGFVFDNADSDGLREAVGRALAYYREPLTWRRLQLQGMAQDFSWDASASNYIALYRDIAGRVPAPDGAVECARQVAV